MPNGDEIRIQVESGGEVSALLLRPAKAQVLLILAHGAGAGLHHPFMQKLAGELARVNIATLRFQFPYMEQKRRVPDAPAVLVATVLAATRAASEAAPGLLLLAGGKSMGGRMASQAAAQQLLAGVEGWCFSASRFILPTSQARSARITCRRFPCRCCSCKEPGIRFADLKLLRPVCAKLGKRALLHVVESADHSFHVLKRSGTNDDAVLRELAQKVASWAESL